MLARSLFSKPKTKKPAGSLVGGYQCSGAAALSAACKSDTLLDNTTSKIGIN
jgi:hypothetical protein